MEKVYQVKAAGFYEKLDVDGVGFRWPSEYVSNVKAARFDEGLMVICGIRCQWAGADFRTSSNSFSDVCMSRPFNEFIFPLNENYSFTFHLEKYILLLAVYLGKSTCTNLAIFQHCSKRHFTIGPKSSVRKRKLSVAGLRIFGYTSLSLSKVAFSSPSFLQLFFSF